MPLSSTHSSSQLTFSPAPDRTHLFVAVGLLLLFAWPYVWLGEDAYLTINDNLDDASYNFRPLLLSGQAFSFSPTAVLPNIMNGLPRSTMHSGSSYEVWLFALLPMFQAFVLNLIFAHGVGYVGMFQLLRRHFLPRPDQRSIVLYLSIGFALVPTYTNLGLSVMGQPLLLYAFLNLRKGTAHWTDGLLILLFPFFSFLVRSGLSVLIGLTIIGVYELWSNRSAGTARTRWLYWVAVSALGGLYLLVDFPMIWSYVSGQFVPHRVEFRYYDTSFRKSLLEAGRTFLKGQYHAGTLFTVMPLGLWLLSLRRPDKKSLLLTTTIVAVCGFISLLHGFYPYWLQRAGRLGFVLQAFQLDRFYFLLPLLWFVLTARVVQTLRPAPWLYGLLLAHIGLTLAGNPEWTTNIRLMTGLPVGPDKVPYRAFFAEKLFADIQRHIGRPQSSYRVVSLGMHPIVAQCNGFYTLDSYQNNYPLAYKHEFRTLIADELGKNTAVRRYFDYWGSRCYVYPAELNMNCLLGKHAPQVVRRLAFPVRRFRKMGGRYILSAVPIANAPAIGLTLEKIFSRPDAHWRIFLYRAGGVDEPKPVQARRL